jgi:hypothetical protein
MFTYSRGHPSENILKSDHKMICKIYATCVTVQMDQTVNDAMEMISECFVIAFFVKRIPYSKPQKKIFHITKVMTACQERDISGAKSAAILQGAGVLVTVTFVTQILTLLVTYVCYPDTNIASHFCFLPRY